MTSMRVNEIVEILETLLPAVDGPYHLHEPVLGDLEEEMLTTCIREGYVSYLGRLVTEFEEKLAEISGVKFAIAVTNGTVAIHALLSELNIGNGDEVICPALTFAGTVNAITHAGAIPHFVEVEEEMLGIDPEALKVYLTKISIQKKEGVFNRETGRQIKALMPVHIFGHPCNIQALKVIAEEYSLLLIEDCAESIGTLYHGHPLGSYGIGSILSFNGNKIVTTGGGGAILTNDEALARRIKHMATTAKVPHAWRIYHDRAGFNYRMPNINAAIGVAQLKRLPKLLEQKRAIALLYERAFQNAKHWQYVKEPQHAKSNFWLNAIKLDVDSMEVLENSLEALSKKGFHCRPIWTPAHQLPMYKECPKMDLNLTEKLSRQILCLPSSPKLFGAMNG